jgi:hypothetical protein
MAMLAEQGDVTDETLLRVYSGREGAVVQLPKDATRFDAGLWGSILALAAEELARDYAARGEGREHVILRRILRGFAAEVASMLQPQHLRH